MALSSRRDTFVAPRSAGPLRIWATRHVSTLVASLGRLARQPFASFLTVLVIAVSLALPAALHLVVKNARALSGGWDNALDFSVYLEPQVALADAERLRDLVAQRADVAAVELIPADAALEAFKGQSGLGEALGYLDENPLPHTLVVRPADGATEATVMLLNEELGNLPETDIVQFDTAWVRRFLAILDIVEHAIGIGSVLLGAAIVIIIGNTIRLDIENRREEIEVTKLIGASDAFVRRPFLYSGFWYGLWGGLLALALLAYGLHALGAPVSRLSGLYGGGFRLLALGAAEGLAVVGCGVLLGLTGSWVAAARHMRRIEPR